MSLTGTNGNGSKPMRSGPRGFALREEAVDDLAALEESSVDYYAAMRSAYLQTREAMIQEP